jgi:SAM-dependent methyltransferase
MRREKLFTTAGFYGFVLRSNALLHREASRWATALLGRELPGIAGRPLQVLDLACGGHPATIADVMAAFPQRRFAYTGIDLNPDQVRRAREEFTFPDNVAPARVVEGNAWDLDAMGITGPFDVVFSGMNLHHGTPEEIRLLALQLARRLSPGGVFLSHDVFRPDDQPQRRRPDVNPANPTESYRLVDPERLAAAGIAAEPIAYDDGPEEPAWRRDYLERMRRALTAGGGHPEGIAETLAHMQARDFPISTALFRQIFAGVGFEVATERGTQAHPLGPYIAFCSARRPGG